MKGRRNHVPVKKIGVPLAGFHDLKRQAQEQLDKMKLLKKQLAELEAEQRRVQK